VTNRAFEDVYDVDVLIIVTELCVVVFPCNVCFLIQYPKARAFEVSPTSHQHPLGW
jgi:hypothetical protein